MEVHLDVNGAPAGGMSANIVTALARLADGESNEARVFCRRPERDQVQLGAFIEAAIGLGVPTTAVTIVTPHPCAGWLRALAARSLGSVALEVRAAPAHDLIGKWTVEEALRVVCPELHLKGEDEVELSVCGGHADHMVVSAEQLGRWCMADHRTCPHKIRRSTESR